MVNYVDLTVPCRMNPNKKETFRVYYFKTGDIWEPFPVDICDNGCGAKSCLECASDVFRQAQTRKPPLLR